MKQRKSPCIDICNFTGPKGWCLGCGRTKEESRKWRNLKPYDKIKILKNLKKRMLVLEKNQVFRLLISTFWTSFIGL